MENPNPVKSLETCYRLADERRDAGDDACADAVGFAAGAAAQSERWLKRLAYAVCEKNARKRRAILNIVLAERDANDFSNGDLPFRTTDSWTSVRHHLDKPTPHPADLTSRPD